MQPALKQLRQPRIGGAIYLLPNLLTTGNLFFGFFSIVASLQGKLDKAAWAILLAAVFDVLDGRVARLTKSSSEFGVQYDSQCDLISFGLAPAFLMYQFGLSSLGRVGWIMCFLYLACGALRLSRFNVQSSIGKASGDFTGLPIPMAAGFVACFVSLILDLAQADKHLPGFLGWLVPLAQHPNVPTMFLLVGAPLLALAMVSNIRYRSHKTLRITRVKPFRLLVMAVVFIAVVAFQPELVGFLVFLSYALSGPIEWALGWKKPDDDDEIFAQADDNEGLDPIEEKRP